MRYQDNWKGINLTFLFWGWALSFFWGAGAHLLDLLSLRQNFSEMNLAWKIFTVYLLIFDLITCIGFLRDKWYGTVGFFLVTIPQIFTYTIFPDTFGEHFSLLYAHCLNVACYLYFGIILDNRRNSQIPRAE